MKETVEGTIFIRMLGMQSLAKNFNVKGSVIMEVISISCLTNKQCLGLSRLVT